MLIAIVCWIFAGLLAGFVASKCVNLRGDDPSIGIMAALAGAIIAGIAFSVLSGRGMVAWDLWNVLSAVVGGIAGAVIYHGIRSRSIVVGSRSIRRSY